MAAGLPTACSECSAMPEILSNTGLYFDIHDTNSIVEVLYRLIKSPELRTKKAKVAHKIAKNYSWDKCANDTFGFFANIVKKET